MSVLIANQARREIPMEARLRHRDGSMLLASGRAHATPWGRILWALGGVMVTAVLAYAAHVLAGA